MTIEAITDTELFQRCGNCAAVNRIELVSLTVGMARAHRVDERGVRLPACPTCHSSEFLFRSLGNEPDHPSPGSLGHLHRLLVDHLHAELAGREQVAPQLRDEHGTPKPGLARPPAPEMLAQWFKQGLQIEGSTKPEADNRERPAEDRTRPE